jgi:putative hydrolase of the HAD superfamily
MNPKAPKTLSTTAIQTWLFDLDNTLYPAASGLFHQIDRRMGQFIAAHLGVDALAARTRQKQLFRQHGTTLRGMMVEYGIAPQPYLDYVHDIDFSVLAAAPDLNAALARLPGRKLVFTNASVPYAQRVLDRLGIAGHFEAVFDIVAADFLPKPDARPYRQICARYGVDPTSAAMVEDMAVNLAPAHALGMGTVWVRPEPDLAPPDDSATYIHHTTDDLAGWLAGLA